MRQILVFSNGTVRSSALLRSLTCPNNFGACDLAEATETTRQETEGVF